MSVANSYAKALYETVAEKNSPAEVFNRIEAQFDEITAMMNQSREVKAALIAPVTNMREKVSLIEALSTKMQLEPVFTQFLKLLAKKGRMSLVGEIREAFITVRLAHEGGVSGRLVSAEPMSEADIASLAQAFSEKFGKRVAFQVSTDPSLLAGMKVTVNGTTFDGTLRSQLQKLRDRFVTGFTGNA